MENEVDPTLHGITENLKECNKFWVYHGKGRDKSEKQKTEFKGVFFDYSPAVGQVPKTFIPCPDPSNKVDGELFLIAGFKDGAAHRYSCLFVTDLFLFV